MNKMTILHLSDIHFKLEEKETTPTFRQDVTTKLIEAIKQHLDKHHVVPDVVAVTGDIAYSGKEYDEAKIFFKDLKSVLPDKTEFLAIPGNRKKRGTGENDEKTIKKRKPQITQITQIFLYFFYNLCKSV